MKARRRPFPMVIMSHTFCNIQDDTLGPDVFFIVRGATLKRSLRV